MEGDIGEHRLQMGIKDALPLLRQLKEALAAPEDILRGQIKRPSWAGGKEHIAGAGGVHAAVKPLDILAQTLLGSLAAAAAQQEEGHGGHALADGQAHIKGDGRQGKQHQAQREDRDIRPEVGRSVYSRRIPPCFGGVRCSAILNYTIIA